MRRTHELPGLKRDEGIGKERTFESPEKAEARQNTIIDLYRKVSGLKSIPADRQYVCLCAKQTTNKYAELVQLVTSRLITEEQYHGIDRDEENKKLAGNRERFPKACWWKGEWIEQIEKLVAGGIFNPAIVYFDTFYTAAREKVYKDTVRTMLVCPAETLLVVNVSADNVYAGRWYGAEVFVGGWEKYIPRTEWDLWKFDFPHYLYRSSDSQSTMATFMMWKKSIMTVGK